MWRFMPGLGLFYLREKERPVAQSGPPSSLLMLLIPSWWEESPTPGPGPTFLPKGVKPA